MCFQFIHFFFCKIYFNLHSELHNLALHNSAHVVHPPGIFAVLEMSFFFFKFILVINKPHASFEWYA